jgi:probable HAF family extracellular repeat protein
MPRPSAPPYQSALRPSSTGQLHPRSRKAVPAFVALLAIGIGCGRDADSPTAPTLARSAAYRVIDLGTLTSDPLQDFSVATAINAGGTIVGLSLGGTGGGTRAVRWDQGVIRDLGDLGGGSATAVGINNRGDIVGASNLPGTHVHAALWKPTGRIQDLGVLAGGDYSEAMAINSRGWIVGWSNREPTPPGDIVPDHAVLWRDGTIVPLAPDAFLSRAFDINDAGVVVGVMLSGSPLRGRGFIWDRGQLTELGLPEGWDSSSASLTAVGINGRRRVVGFGSVTDFDAGIFEVRAVLWERAGVVDLGTLGGGGAAFPRAINSRGQIVGGLNTASPVTQRAFLWDRGITTILPGLEETFSEASGINASSEIVGVSGSHAVLWTAR